VGALLEDSQHFRGRIPWPSAQTPLAGKFVNDNWSIRSSKNLVHLVVYKVVIN